MIKPKRLEPDSTIGIISPSYWLDDKILSTTRSYYDSAGYKTIVGESCKLRWGPFAGTPQERAKDINEMFANPEINAILCARGGYGANRVLPLINYNLIKKNPKIFIGFSDITAYLHSITQNTNLVTFHGPMLVSHKHEFVEFNFNCMEKVISGNSPVVIKNPKSLTARVLKEGNAKGPILGGNMCLLSNRLGTNMEIDTAGKILFLEDIDEYLYSFERMLLHMRDANIFEKIKGLIFGELCDFKDQEIPFGRNSDEIIMDICGDLDIPIVSNFACGHGKYQVTLPISVPAMLNTNGGNPEITILESPTKEEE
tara:strand:- start:65 stop:1003 length:939 start_codon:yes stop_codon:yes gene_type:complete